VSAPAVSVCRDSAPVADDRFHARDPADRAIGMATERSLQPPTSGRSPRHTCDSPRVGRGPAEGPKHVPPSKAALAVLVVRTRGVPPRRCHWNPSTAHGCGCVPPTGEPQLPPLLHHRGRDTRLTQGAIGIDARVDHLDDLADALRRARDGDRVNAAAINVADGMPPPVTILADRA
jgi:hypothetical protein